MIHQKECGRRKFCDGLPAGCSLPFSAMSKKKHFNDWGCFELEFPCDSGSLFPAPWCLTLWSGFWYSSTCLSHPIYPDWCHRPSQQKFHPSGSPLLILFPEIPSLLSKFCQFSKLTLSPTPSKKPTKIFNHLNLAFPKLHLQFVITTQLVSWYTLFDP